MAQRRSFAWFVACRILFVRSVRCLSLSFTLTLFHAVFETIVRCDFQCSSSFEASATCFLNWICHIFRNFWIRINWRSTRQISAFFIPSIVILFALLSGSYHIRLAEVSFRSYFNIRERRGHNESKRCEWSVRLYYSTISPYSLQLSYVFIRSRLRTSGEPTVNNINSPTLYIIRVAQIFLEQCSNCAGAPARS